MEKVPQNDGVHFDLWGSIFEDKIDDLADAILIKIIDMVTMNLKTALRNF